MALGGDSLSGQIDPPHERHAQMAAGTALPERFERSRRGGFVAVSCAIPSRRSIPGAQQTPLSSFALVAATLYRENRSFACELGITSRQPGRVSVLPAAKELLQ